MPYIAQEQRKILDPVIKELATLLTRLGDGAINYAFTQLLLKVVKPNRYIDFQRCVGILECCKLEFYRRAAAPYENLKAKENGDVFEYIEGGQLK